jgi:hypothetical protein
MLASFSSSYAAMFGYIRLINDDVCYTVVSRPSLQSALLSKHALSSTLVKTQLL